MDIDANIIIEKLLNNIKSLTLNNVIKDIQIEQLNNQIAEMKKLEEQNKDIK